MENGFCFIGASQGQFVSYSIVLIMNCRHERLTNARLGNRTGFCLLQYRVCRRIEKVMGEKQWGSLYVTPQSIVTIQSARTLLVTMKGLLILLSLCLMNGHAVSAEEESGFFSNMVGKR